MNRNMQSGFTLIELVMVIVILGILAATALPKYIDLKDDAAKAVASGALAAAQGAATMNYAKSMINAANTKITADAAGAAYLKGLMDAPDWSASGATLTATLSGTTYTITISSAETATAPAGFTKSW